MSRIKNVLFSTALVFCTASGSFAGMPLEAMFAGCAGRFSAEMEHAWLHGSADAELHQERRAMFVSLLQAIVPKEEAREFLGHRINAKLAHSSLLTIAAFEQDQSRAKAARSAARRHVSACRMMLLDG